MWNLIIFNRRSNSLKLNAKRELGPQHFFFRGKKVNSRSFSLISVCWLIRNINQRKRLVQRLWPCFFDKDREKKKPKKKKNIDWCNVKVKWNLIFCANKKSCLVTWRKEFDVFEKKKWEKKNSYQPLLSSFKYGRFLKNPTMYSTKLKILVELWYLYA